MKEFKLRQFIIKVGTLGGSFIGDHGLIHEPTLKVLVGELKEIIKSLSKEKK